ncbi:MAG: hypothetical protein AB3N64_03415 [Puniceicoccaceae bacterium]
MICSTGLQAKQVVTVDRISSSFPVYATDVSSDGAVIVGEDFHYGDGQFTQIPDVLLVGVSDDGTTAAGLIWHGSSGSPGSTVELTGWEAGKLNPLGYPVGSENVQPSCISGDGNVIAGFALFEPGGWMGFIWKDGEFSILQNSLRPILLSYDGTVIIGEYPGSLVQGNLESGVFAGLDKLPISNEYGVNDMTGDGSTLVGYYQIASEGGMHHACRWVDGKIEALEELPGTTTSSALHVSGDGSIILGNMSGDATDDILIIWPEYNGYKPLSIKDMLVSHGHNPKHLNNIYFNPDTYHANAILSEDGTTIVCWYNHQGDPRSYLLRIQMLNMFGPHRIHDNHCDTGDWMGWLNVELEPWAYCLKTQSWFYIPEAVAESGSGWIYIPNLTTNVPELWLVMEGETSWGYSYGLGKWMYVTASGWVYLFG